MLTFTIIFILSITVKTGLVEAQPAKFRILAPQFICPKDDEVPIDKPDTTVITIQTEALSDVRFSWTVRWKPLVAPTQRFTLLLWKAVRALEVALNRPQPEPLVYIIENNELLQGVDYIFNVTAIDAGGSPRDEKSFHIDNTQGNYKLNNIEGRGDLMSIILVGAQTSYADLPFLLEAQITTCFPTQDYYFVWSVQSSQSDFVNVSSTRGYKLEIPPFSLQPGNTYYVVCQVIKQSDGYLNTQTGLLIEVRLRNLRVYLSTDYLMITVKHSFEIEAMVSDNEYYKDFITFEWNCSFAGKTCSIDSMANSTFFHLPAGLPDLGQYEFQVEVTVGDQSASAKMTVATVEPTLPVIKIPPKPRVVNEGSRVSLSANASNVAPTCTLTWYFATNDDVAIMSPENNETCEDCQHGEPLSDTLTIFSLEENFLNELTDFTNETEWRQVTATMEAKAGRARFVAQCGCSLTFECDTLGTVYADVHFEVNESPVTSDLKVSPENGSALETVFRLTTVAAVDLDTPIKYSFYCLVGTNGTLLLDYFIEQLWLETVLPYVEGGTEVFIEACDSFGACSRSGSVVVEMTPSDGSTVDVLIDEMRGHVRRCELAALRTVAVSSIASFTNAGQQDLLSKFTVALHSSMQEIDEACTKHDLGTAVYSDIMALLDKNVAV